MEAKNSSIIIYQSEDGKTRIEVKLENETVWLTQQQLCDLYQTSRTNIVEHIQHIYEDGELEESATCRNSDRFVRKVPEWSKESYHTIISI